MNLEVKSVNFLKNTITLYIPENYIQNMCFNLDRKYVNVDMSYFQRSKDKTKEHNTYSLEFEKETGIDIHYKDNEEDNYKRLFAYIHWLENKLKSEVK